MRTRISVKLGWLMPRPPEEVSPYIRRAVHEGLGVMVRAEFAEDLRYLHVDLLGVPLPQTEKLVQGFVMGLLFSMGIEIV